MNGKNWLHIDQNLGNKNVKLDKGKGGIIIVRGNWEHCDEKKPGLKQFPSIKTIFMFLDPD